MRVFLSIVSAILVSLNGTLVAAGHSAGGGTLAMVICAGDSVETVWVDGNGQPVDESQTDCDCDTCLCAIGFGDLFHPPASPMDFGTVVAAHGTGGAQFDGATNIQKPMPRGPPLAVLSEIRPHFHLRLSGQRPASWVTNGFDQVTT
ncbi:hypothetical protein KUH32_17580 [Thalassococcus sp. CAU 1522]|uniref:DUF2946 domain-containing protein n=1 Tax=Thalassococcus arenae TaxID=2851652 RepID=A0ABS6NC37_9RHOB|nr:hypothetical protein [Thalassococcus arenae]MBV2361579.1 hypothetical protein [Thalassococcus arenae]